MNEQNQEIICKNCGAANGSAYKFCSSCGAPLETSDAQKQEASEPIQINYEQEPVFERPAEEPEIVESSSYGPIPEPVMNRAQTMAENQGLAIASMVCGILSIVCCCISSISLLLGIAAVVMGIITLNKGYAGRGMAIAGIICGAIGGLIGIVAIVAVGVTGLASDSLKELQNFI